MFSPYLGGGFSQLTEMNSGHSEKLSNFFTLILVLVYKQVPISTCKHHFLFFFSLINVKHKIRFLGFSFNLRRVQ